MRLLLLLLLPLLSLGQTYNTSGTSPLTVGTTFTVASATNLTGFKFNVPKADTYTIRLYAGSTQVWSSNEVFTSTGSTSRDITPIELSTGITYTIAYYNDSGFYTNAWIGSLPTLNYPPFTYLQGLYTYANARPVSNASGFYFIEPLSTSTTPGGGGAPVTGGGENIIFTADFETLPVWSGWDNACDLPYSYSGARTDTISRSGNYAIRWELRKTDVGACGGSKRAELFYGFNEPDSSLHWYGFSNWLPSAFVYDTLPEILAQWHDNPEEGCNDDTDPILSLQVDRGKWLVKLVYNTNNACTDVPFGSNYKVINWYLGPATTGEWNDWVFHVNFNWDSTKGFIRVWRNGVNVINYEGPAGFKINGGIGKPLFFKTGIYKPFWMPFWETIGAFSLVTERYYYADNYRFGNWDAQLSDFIITDSLPDPEPPIVSVPDYNTTSTSVTLVSSVTSDTAITNYSWTRLTGPNTPSVSVPVAGQLTLSGLVDGTYTYRITVTDANGLTASDTSTIVKTSIINNNPTVSMGAGGLYVNQSTVIPNITATDIEDGEDLTYEWVQLSGPTATMSSATSKNPTFSNLPAGQYSFQVTVHDQDGGSAMGVLEFRVRFSVSGVRFKGKVKIKGQ